MSTRGIRFLEQHGIRFEEMTYIFKQKGASRAADAVGWEQSQVIKSLVVQLPGKDLRFALVPADRELSLKKLARLYDAKQVDMASVKDAERVTGYMTGGISPFGSYAILPVVLEETLLAFDQVLINAGHRGVLVRMSPWDIQSVLDADVQDIIA